MREFMKVVQFALGNIQFGMGVWFLHPSLYGVIAGGWMIAGLASMADANGNFPRVALPIHLSFLGLYAASFIFALWLDKTSVMPFTEYGLFAYLIMSAYVCAPSLLQVLLLKVEQQLLLPGNEK